MLAAIAALTAPGDPECNKILFVQYGEKDGPFS